MATPETSIPEEYLTDYIFRRHEQAAVLAAITPNPDDPVIDEVLFLDALILKPDCSGSLDNKDPDDLHHGD